MNEVAPMTKDLKFIHVSRLLAQEKSRKSEFIRKYETEFSTLYNISCQSNNNIIDKAVTIKIKKEGTFDSTYHTTFSLASFTQTELLKIQEADIYRELHVYSITCHIYLNYKKIKHITVPINL